MPPAPSEAAPPPPVQAPPGEQSTATPEPAPPPVAPGTSVPPAPPNGATAGSPVQLVLVQPAIVPPDASGKSSWVRPLIGLVAGLIVGYGLFWLARPRSTGEQEPPSGPEPPEPSETDVLDTDLLGHRWFDGPDLDPDAGEARG
ncbi:hypothetical protein A5663_16145 [Mycobacterium sp. E740]|nr:hypothetical protein A5663_00410 [Mycobacterium sp. E740]OBI81299.1 hypothetical protein A5663_16145 [Mycobacterium sp. E740]